MTFSVPKLLLLLLLLRCGVEKCKVKRMEQWGNTETGGEDMIRET
jgi:hypothetical protein